MATALGGHDEAGHDHKAIVMGIAEPGRDLLRVVQAHTKHYLLPHIVRFVKEGLPNPTLSVTGSPGRIDG